MSPTLEDYQRKVSEIKILKAKYQEAQKESNLALARYKRALVELTEM